MNVWTQQRQNIREKSTEQAQQLEAQNEGAKYFQICEDSQQIESKNIKKFVKEKKKKEKKCSKSIT